ncbi:site-2 protease family protein [Cerasicoccus fimbriatus]|uniref:site-2 protease family protein n=1 Tax=Cerasicoccus fimbriatus TaxID=3014554 RepID=UPI0022B519A6|nr:site-2 protease family protein [Cerasicoccus sp. TK19100]
MSNTSWKIGRLFGIQLEIHFTFFLLLGFYIYVGHQAIGWRGSLTLGIMIVLVFVSVALHELGHCLTAQRYGIKVPRIVFMAIGGMAQMGSIPRDPRKEMIITINGPLVNFAIAAILFVVLCITYRDVGYVAEGSVNLLRKYFTDDYVRSPYNPWSLSWVSFAWGLLGWNIAMGLFNLLPIFPMDGGRLLRAALAKKFNYLQASKIAATAAKVIAAVLIAWALLVSQHYLLAVLLVFIWIGGDEELKYVAVIEQYVGKTVSDVMVDPPKLPDNTPMSKHALQAHWLVDDHTAEIFSSAAAFPVHAEGELVGVVYPDLLWEKAGH